MEIIDKLKGLLKEVGDHITTQRSQFGSKILTKLEKDKILEMVTKMETCKTLCETLVDGLKLVVENKNSDIERIVKTSLQSIQSIQPTTPRPTYSNVATSSVSFPKKKTINKNKIIIKAEDIEKFDKELKQKICPSKERVNVTFYKKLTSIPLSSTLPLRKNRRGFLKP